MPVLDIKVKELEDEPKQNGKGKHDRKFLWASENQRSPLNAENQSIDEKNVAAPGQGGKIGFHERNPRKEEDFRGSDNPQAKPAVAFQGKSPQDFLYLN